jgi:hypothetical protein
MHGSLSGRYYSEYEIMDEGKATNLEHAFASYKLG